ncbi:hypothetical protein K227x_56080 [Rubripirellula lacrimiformis]|uniref:Uncharacterized protein n=1 Tax=Rubripirellula lacrimiformis TaxID=1930273 RepID=A0A517NJH8_9BACT|nr:hypothetical protein [Rubripirellula lacrimiformis]QDT07183.1 hypothetical protein K227x_56080 [Rubripirellula lacrimiformis]
MTLKEGLADGGDGGNGYAGGGGDAGAGGALFVNTGAIVNAQFAGVGGAGSTANGLDLGRDWAIAGGGFAARPSDR